MKYLILNSSLNGELFKQLATDTGETLEDNENSTSKKLKKTLYKYMSLINFLYDL